MLEPIQGQMPIAQERRCSLRSAFSSSWNAVTSFVSGKGKLPFMAVRGAAVGYATASFLSQFTGPSPYYALSIAVGVSVEALNWALREFDACQPARNKLSRAMARLTCGRLKDAREAFEEDPLEYTWMVVENGILAAELGISTAEALGIKEAVNEGARANPMVIYGCQIATVMISIANFKMVYNRLKRHQTRARDQEALPLVAVNAPEELTKLQIIKAHATNEVTDMASMANSLSGLFALISMFGDANNPWLPSNVQLYVKWGIFPLAALRNGIELYLNRNSEKFTKLTVIFAKDLTSANFISKLAMQSYNAVYVKSHPCQMAPCTIPINNIYAVTMGVLVPIVFAHGRTYASNPDGPYGPYRPWLDVDNGQAQGQQPLNRGGEMRDFTLLEEPRIVELDEEGREVGPNFVHTTVHLDDSDSFSADSDEDVVLEVAQLSPARMLQLPGTTALPQIQAANEPRVVVLDSDSDEEKEQTLRSTVN